MTPAIFAFPHMALESGDAGGERECSHGRQLRSALPGSPYRSLL